MGGIHPGIPPRVYGRHTPGYTTYKGRLKETSQDPMNRRLKEAYQDPMNRGNRG